MSIRVLFLFMLLFTHVAGQEAGLPNFLTKEEKIVQKSYNPPLGINGFRQQPVAGVRAMAEWEELQGIQITWTSYPAILAQIVDYAQEEVTVFIVCSDSNQVKNYLRLRGIPLVNLHFLVEPYNSIWCRDYGPWTAYDENTDSLYIIDWIYNRPRPSDDLIPAAIADEVGVPLYDAVQDPDDLVHTGGNFMVDGHGNAFSSKLILEENPDKTESEIDDILSRYLGISNYIKMDNLPYDEIHHIDMHMKLLDEETLLVGEYPTGVADGPQIEENLQYILSNFQTCFGRDFEVIRIPMPPDASGRYPDNNGDYRTYTNSIIINKTVIVPVYEEQYDTTALRIYREAMPGYNIAGIDCNDIIPSLGAIHCITKEIGARDPLFISHAKIRRAYDQQVSFPAEAVIRSNSGISHASLFWSTDTASGFTEEEMIQNTEDIYSAQIPGQPAGTKIFYYISAESGSGKTGTKPPVAPDGLYAFTVQGASGLTAHAGLIHTFQLFQNFPNPFNPVTKIKYHLKESGYVELSVHDITGKRMSAIVTENQHPGSYEYELDAGDWPSGVYFYTLRVNDNQTAKKCLLVK